MNDNTDISAQVQARERMLDVDLHAALQTRDAKNSSTHPAGIQRRRASAPLLAAAVALLGLTMTVLIAWQQGQPLAPAQDPIAPPAAMPLCVWITKPQDIANTPADTQNLAVYSKALDDYGQLAGFKALRRLMILGPGLPEPATATLLPLSKLHNLEELELPVSADMLPEHLRALAKMTKVRSLRLHCKRAITREHVRALKLMPQLRVLILHGGQLDVATVRSLSELPHLDELNLQGVAGCTEEVLVQLRVLHRLRRLTLTSIGEQPLAAQLGETPTPGAGLTPAIARALGDLPLLRELKLVTCKVTTAALAALPTGLRAAYLVRCPDVCSNDLLALKHCRNLTTLGLDNHDVTRWRGAIPQEFLAKPTDTADAQAELIRDLPLRQLDYTSAMPTAVRLAVTAKQTLTHVNLHWFERGDLETVATLANLNHLTLNEGRGIELARLKVLARCKSLKTITVRSRSWPTAEIQQLLPGVKVVSDRR